MKTQPPLVVARATAAAAAAHEEEEEVIVYFPLDGLLPAGYRLAFYAPLGILTLLLTPGSAHGARKEEEQRQEEDPVIGDHARIAGMQRFTPSEASLLLPILTSYPDYCPMEVLLAHFSSSRVSEQVIERMREMLYRALSEGDFDQVMRPARNVLSRVRLKLRELGLSIVSLLETGYLLKAVDTRRPQRKESWQQHAAPR